MYIKISSANDLILIKNSFKKQITIRLLTGEGNNMRYNDQTLNPDLDDKEVIPNLEEVSGDDKSDKKIKAHVVRRNIEDYLERKALERSLKEVFDDDYLLD